MSEGQTAAWTPLTEKQQNTVYSPTQQWSREFALKVAVQDFQRAEAYRTQNCDWRWRTHNELYQAWVQQKYWEGTKIPRASVPVYVAFEQIESMLPKIMAAVFSENPWFQADRVGQTTAAEAQQWRNVIADQLDRTRVREIFRRCIKSGLLYGNGIAKLSWIYRAKEQREWLPKMQMGQSGSVERRFEKRTITLIENRPSLEYVSLANFFIDPNCFSPQVTDAQYTAERKLVTVEDLESLRGVDQFYIPDKMKLLEYAIHKPSIQADATLSTSELFRLGYWAPQTDQTVDPGRGRIELIEYWTPERTVFVINRESCILNVPNSQGFMPYYDAFYADVLDRFYALGVADVVEGEQRLQGALLNGRLDELALSLHRPMIKKMGVKMPAHTQRIAPGRIWEAEKPKEDFQFLDIPNITQNAYIENNASELRVQKVTGQSDLYSSGTQGSGGNSASRTATGIGAQVQASGSRIQYIVANLEDAFIEPILNDCVKLNQMFPPIGTSYADTIAMSRVRLSMRASAKIQSKMALMQTWPLFVQTILNPALMSELGMVGETVDWREVMRAFTDFTGYQQIGDFIRKLTPQEMEMRKQAQQSPDMIRMQMQRERIQGQDAIQDKKLAAQGKMEGMKLLTDATLREAEMESGNETEDNYLLMEIVKEGMKQVMAAKAAKEKPSGSKSKNK